MLPSLTTGNFSSEFARSSSQFASSLSVSNLATKSNGLAHGSHRAEIITLGSWINLKSKQRKVDGIYRTHHRRKPSSGLAFVMSNFMFYLFSTIQAKKMSSVRTWYKVSFLHSCCPQKFTVLEMVRKNLPMKCNIVTIALVLF